MSRIGIIIQARTGSSRLPNKVILPFYNEFSIIELLIKRLSVLKENGYAIILSTTNKQSDNVLVEIALKYGISYFRGNEHDVLSRFCATADFFKLSKVVRVCSDNPFMDINGILHLIKLHEKTPSLDYYSFKNYKGIPVIRTHIGLFAEIVTVKALKKASQLCQNLNYREHVTSFIYENNGIFCVSLEKSFSEVYNREDLRFTIDDISDFKNLSLVYDYFIQNDYDIRKTIGFVDSRRDIKQIMTNNIKKYDK